MTTSVVAEDLGLSLDTRLRAEHNDTQLPTTTPATAVTWRVAPQWTSPTREGFKAVFQVQAVLALVRNYSLPNEANGTYDIIEDPQIIDLGDTYCSWAHASGFEARVGREAVALDDHRWVSHQPWRQKQQSLDGAHLGFHHDGWIADYLLTLAQDDPLDVRILQRSHTARAGWGVQKIGTAALLVQRIDANSSFETNTDSLGVIVGNMAEDWEGVGPIYHFEYATQQPGRAATWTGTRQDLLAMGGLAWNKWNSASLSYERIGEDDAGLGFAHPLSYNRFVGSGYVDITGKLSLWGTLPRFGIEPQFHVYKQLSDGQIFAKEFKIDVVHDLGWIIPLNGTRLEMQFDKVLSTADFLAKSSVQLALGYRHAW